MIFKRVLRERYDLCMNFSLKIQNVIVIEDRHFVKRARHSVQFHIRIRWPQMFSSCKMAFNLIRVVVIISPKVFFHFRTRDDDIQYVSVPHLCRGLCYIYIF